jgi:hypothetical protein
MPRVKAAKFGNTEDGVHAWVFSKGFGFAEKVGHYCCVKIKNWDSNPSLDVAVTS